MNFGWMVRNIWVKIEKEYKAGSILIYKTQLAVNNRTLMIIYVNDGLFSASIYCRLKSRGTYLAECKTNIL